MPGPRLLFALHLVHVRPCVSLLFYPLYIFFIKDSSDLTAVLEDSGMHQKEHVCADSHRNVEDGIR